MKRVRNKSKYISTPYLLKSETVKPGRLWPVLLMEAGGLREEQGQFRREDPREEWFRGRMVFENGNVKCQDLTLK